MIKREELIIKFNILHNNKYDYSSVSDITKQMDIVTIICPSHGEFSQVAKYHLHGRGCPKCAKNIKLTNDEFIKLSNNEHNFKYDYSRVEYKNKKTKVEIICKKHGSFFQTPENHLRGGNNGKGNGCPECNEKKKMNTDDFIAKAIKVHGYKYDYSSVDYISNKLKIKIICPKHGEFHQKPNNHLSGYGCKLCSTSKGELSIKKFLDNNDIKYIDQYIYEDLKFKKCLKFDFAIIGDMNKIKYLIEYNGIQHYEFRKQLHKSTEKFEEQKLKDQMKIDYCKENNIKLYIIRYDDDIKSSMEKIIKENEKENIKDRI